MLGALRDEVPDPDCARNFPVLLTCHCRETLFSCLLKSQVESHAEQPCRHNSLSKEQQWEENTQWQ